MTHTATEGKWLIYEDDGTWFVQRKGNLSRKPFDNWEAAADYVQTKHNERNGTSK